MTAFDDLAKLAENPVEPNETIFWVEECDFRGATVWAVMGKRNGADLGVSAICGSIECADEVCRALALTEYRDACHM